MSIVKNQEKPAVAVGMRAPPELAEWLKEQAAENHRSVANQALWSLMQYRKQLSTTAGASQ